MTDKTFLEYVANDILEKWGTDLSHVAVVFPNKRAALFMNEYLARIAGKPIWSPAYTTISELFRKHSDNVVGDSIKLICDLHKSFVKCTGLNESLDHFYGWGQLLLTDFDDIDKNMADADKIFCNLKDIHELDDISYIDDEQREMLKRFFANFTDDKESELKKRFLSLWSHFADIYHDYNSRLEEQGLMYEGALYRSVAEKDNIQFNYEKYIFVGFNLLQKVEQRLFTILKKAGKAHFYWDFDDYYMPKANAPYASVAGHYIAMYLSDFPNELNTSDKDIYDNMRREKDITFVSASTENAQARYVSTWLKENKRYEDGKNTAVVMCDENILLPVMSSIPPEADKVNITSGYPLNMTPVASLVAMLFDLYTLGHKQGSDFYRMSYANKVLLHPYARYVSEKCADVYTEAKEKHMQYAKSETLTYNDTDEGLKKVFGRYEATGISQNTSVNTLMLKRIADIIKMVGINGHKNDNALFQESVFRMYTVINRLCGLSESGDLDVDENTLRRLMRQLITTTAIPFHGEPIVGIQVMGVLETRNLDFDHLLLLSCNEGKMPKGVNDSSFIPYTIRKAHGLTTIDNKVAIYSYYFHRLLQRAKDITILYNGTADNGKTGEMSRFMTQLLVESNQEIKHKSLVTRNTMSGHTPTAVAKDPNICHVLNNMKSISPSAINKYMKCPLMFFYQYVANIQEPDAEEDTVDNRMFGNIFHRSAQIIYEDMKGRSGIVEAQQIDRYLNSKTLLPAVVDRVFGEELFKTASGTKNNYNGLQIINREVIIKYLRRLLRLDRKQAPFKIIALEDSAYFNLKIWSGQDRERTIRTGGILDRLDMVSDERTGENRIRVVDYKTGMKASVEMNSLEDIFNRDDAKNNHADYFLQAFLYSAIIDSSAKFNPNGNAVCPALLFIAQSSSEDYDPVLEISGEKVEDIRKYKDEYIKQLTSVIEEILDTNAPFEPRPEQKKCGYCTYRKICEINP